MLLKSLLIHGFKSFADKTTIDFHSGVTGIVGPNGCGKSNVVDAIRWVLGETSAKALRGGEMADVIFSGTDKRSPHSMAEVTLTFSDCEKSLNVDYNEVAISRRVYRDGKGEYLINGTVCRLRDINELFMDTGVGQSAYSVMEQGKIDQLLSSKPEERRAVFEEAAGITKFKGQKREALRKLEYTEANLLRITDILAELKRQMGSMQRQANKAKKYQELYRDVWVLDTHLSHKKYNDMVVERDGLQVSINSWQLESERLKAEVAEREEKVGVLRRELERTDAQLGIIRLQHQETQNKAHSAQNRVDFNTERTRELETLISRNEDEIERSRQRLGEQEQELRSAEDTLASVKENIEHQQTQISEYGSRAQRHRDEREQIERDLRELRRMSHLAETAIISANAKISNDQAQLEADSRRHDQLSAELAKLTAEKEDRLREEERLTGEIASLEIQREEQEIQLHAAQQELRNTQADAAQSATKVRESHKVLMQKRSRLEVLQNLIAEGEGLEKGTKSVLSGLNNADYFQNHIRGLLSSYIEVEPDYVKAVEAALGAHLQTIIVSDSTIAEQIIDTLTAEKLGLAVVLPESFLPQELPRQLMTLPSGSMAWAMDRLKVKKPVGPILDYLLGNVLIVPTLHAALELRSVYPDVSFAAQSGEYITAQGIIHGGRSQDEFSSILQRQNEVRDLAVEVELLEEEFKQAEVQAEILREKVGEVQLQIEDFTAVLQRTREARSARGGELGLVKKELEAVANRLESVDWENTELARRKEGLEASLAGQQLALATGQAEMEAHAVRAGELDSALVAAAHLESESAELLNELKTGLAVELRAEQSLRQQHDPMVGRLREMEALIDRRQGEIASYRERLVSASEENEHLGMEIEMSRRELNDLQETMTAGIDQRNEQVEQSRGIERELSEARRAAAQVNDQRGREEIKLTQVGLRVENLANYVAERYQTSMETFQQDVQLLVNVINGLKEKRTPGSTRRAVAKEESREETETEVSATELEEGQDPEPMVMDASGEDDSEMEVEAVDWVFVDSVIAELKQRLDSMGPVNIDAIKEFEELEERHNFLDREFNDLNNSKIELMNIIGKINTETKRMFSETFEQVRVNFIRTFKELFGQGGQANLIMVNEEDPLESGIEIIAKPPGKKPTSITLLSGGERSMTAVALLFSIFMVKPAPFCVLDELDAPLDETNIGRFLNMLDQFIDKSQFVIVTHNKKTMRRADVIYGITMEERGVSKPVGMRLTSEHTGRAQVPEGAAVPRLDAPPADEAGESAVALQAGG